MAGQWQDSGCVQATGPLCSLQCPCSRAEIRTRVQLAKPRLLDTEGTVTGPRTQRDRLLEDERQRRAAAAQATAMPRPPLALLEPRPWVMWPGTRTPSLGSERSARPRLSQERRRRRWLCCGRESQACRALRWPRGERGGEGGWSGEKGWAGKWEGWQAQGTGRDWESRQETWPEGAQEAAVSRKRDTMFVCGCFINLQSNPHRVNMTTRRSAAGRQAHHPTGPEPPWGCRLGPRQVGAARGCRAGCPKGQPQ